ncbi:DEKNAAC102310 [Brettanomyces naardenensis]|uniref:DEKNAAC102310 n=1 Tax=Brettanomyces naardenensis TaxID=13370 RepID=A0A448YL01_BRENA|nr:DEKNAAC102310 [Brettanomyces naardenensis]
MPFLPDSSDSLEKAEVLQSQSEPVEDASAPPPAKWYNWFEPGTSPQEKKLIIKMDFFLMTYMVISWFLKYLDQTNISNAYVSGMQKDLGFNQNQLSWFNTYFNIGIIIGSIPATICAGYFRPHYYLPLMDLAWSLSVLFMYKAKNAQTIFALRFLVGLFESAANPCCHYMIGCWYKKREIMRRSNFFVLAGIIGQATSSYIQSGLIDTMNNKDGLPAWRWLFIIDAVIGLPVVLFGFFFLPDLPQNTKAFWLNDWERKRVVERLNEDGRVNHKLEWSLKYLVPVLKSWQLWAFSIGYSFWCLCAGNYMLQFFELYLQSLKIYSIPYVNNFPTLLSGVNFIVMFTTGVICDLTGRRDIVCFSVGIIVLIGFIITAKAPVSSIPLRKAGYILTGAYGCYTPILAGWCNIVCEKNPILRAVAIPTMIVVGQIVSTPYQQNVFPSSEAPQYKSTNGFYYAIAFTICLFVWTGVAIPFLERYFKKRDEVEFNVGHKANNEEAEDEAANEEE